LTLIKHSLAALRRHVTNPREFAICSAAYVVQIAELKAEIDSYLAGKKVREIKMQRGRNRRYNSVGSCDGGKPMTIQLTLPPELEERLRLEAKRCGQATESIALRVLDQNLPPAPNGRRAAAVAMLERWSKEDESLSSEDAQANAEVLRAVDEDRPSYRKLFTNLLPDEPK
jgi:hypothetical protein